VGWATLGIKFIHFFVISFNVFSAPDVFKLNAQQTAKKFDFKPICKFPTTFLYLILSGDLNRFSVELEN
jgi:hypothetical protein